LNILLIPENFPTDENPIAGIFMKDYVKALQEFSDVTIFNSNPWYRGVYEEVSGAKSFDLHLFNKKMKFPLNLPAYAWWEKQSLNFAKKLPKPDLIYLHGTAQRGKWALQLARYWNVPLVITEHTGPWSAISSRPAILRRVKSVMEQADLVMPVSTHLEKEIRGSGIVPKRTAVLGNPIDTEFFRLRKTPLTATKRILFVGRLDPFKGGLRTLRAFHSLKDDFPDYRLTIAGDGVEAEDIENYIRENQLGPRVEFLRKQLSREEMRTLFHESSFLVFPSEFESFGLVAAEAMATGLPVVITDRTGPKDYSQPSNSIQVDPRDVSVGLFRMVESLQKYNDQHVRESVGRVYGYDSWAKEFKKIIFPFLVKE
jgi:glycosyltransferase involved in cell wall biosynthesis